VHLEPLSFLQKVVASSRSPLNANVGHLKVDNPHRWWYCNTKPLSMEVHMQTVTVSPKYQVVIPKEIRDALQLRPGQKMRVIEYDGRIELIPDRDISELRGFLRGIDTRIEREEDRV
jgi:AbrB family looped-hinge helix DNA binding protein